VPAHICSPPMVCTMVNFEALRAAAPEQRRALWLDVGHPMRLVVGQRCQQFGLDWFAPDSICRARPQRGPTISVCNKGELAHELRTANRLQMWLELAHRRQREFAWLRQSNIDRERTWRSCLSALSRAGQAARVRAVWCGMCRYPQRMYRHKKRPPWQLACPCGLTADAVDESHIVLQCHLTQHARCAAAANMQQMWPQMLQWARLFPSLIWGIFTEAFSKVFDAAGFPESVLVHWVQYVLAAHSLAAERYHVADDGVDDFGASPSTMAHAQKEPRGPDEVRGVAHPLRQLQQWSPGTAPMEDAQLQVPSRGAKRPPPTLAVAVAKRLHACSAVKPWMPPSAAAVAEVARVLQDREARAGRA